jgi:hypothetical protein
VLNVQYSIDMKGKSLGMWHETIVIHIMKSRCKPAFIILYEIEPVHSFMYIYILSVDELHIELLV